MAALVPVSTKLPGYIRVNMVRAKRIVVSHWHSRDVDLVVLGLRIPRCSVMCFLAGPEFLIQEIIGRRIVSGHVMSLTVCASHWPVASRVVHTTLPLMPIHWFSRDDYRFFHALIVRMVKNELIVSICLHQCRLHFSRLIENVLRGEKAHLAMRPPAILIALFQRLTVVKATSSGLALRVRPLAFVPLLTALIASWVVSRDCAPRVVAIAFASLDLAACGTVGRFPVALGGQLRILFLLRP